jgi:hypothetical protein
MSEDLTERSGSVPQAPPTAPSVVAVHLTPKIDETCDHEWAEGDDGPSHCTKCDLSFTRYIHSCMP